MSLESLRQRLQVKLEVIKLPQTNNRFNSKDFSGDIVGGLYPRSFQSLPYKRGWMENALSQFRSREKDFSGTSERG